MEIVTLIITSIAVIITAIFVMGININKIKTLKNLAKDKSLTEITNKFPENTQVCKDILIMLNNQNVNIKNASEESTTSLYIVASNTILIGNTKDTFTRIQTIAHECIHSTQSKRLLWFNFALSNVYLFYTIIITIMALINKLPNINVFATILVMMSILLYYVRSYIETDAMLRAKNLAKDYMEQHRNTVKQEDVDRVIENYENINQIGVKLYNLKLLVDYLFKIIVFSIVAYI